jgi:ABC-2 type transport system permease protein
MTRTAPPPTTDAPGADDPLALPPPRSPGLGAWLQLTGAEMRMVARDTAGLVIPIGLPLLLLVMNGLGTGREPIPELGGRSALDAVVLPLTLTMVVAVVGIVNMPSFLASYRKTGVLRRLAVTPCPPAMVLVAQVLTSIAHSLVGIGLAVGVAVVAFDVEGPRRLGVALGVLALAAAAMYAVGMVVAAVSPTPNSAIAIGLVAFFLTLALGGGFGPVDALPEGLARVGEALPFGAASAALQAAWVGDAVELRHLGALAGVTGLSAALAAWRFRWD